jgi:hypothetical protein
LNGVGLKQRVSRYFGWLTGWWQGLGDARLLVGLGSKISASHSHHCGGICCENAAAGRKARDGHHDSEEPLSQDVKSLSGEHGYSLQGNDT